MTATAQFAQQPLYTYHSRADVAFVGGDDGGYGILPDFITFLKFSHEPAL